jgi:hypothetical protein
MPADIIPLPPPEPSPRDVITPLPPPIPPPPEAESPGAEADSLSKLLRNPMVIAAGAMLAGMALTRLFASSPMRRLARDLADEALKRARPAPESPPAPTLLEQGLDAVRPQITEAARRFLSEVLRKP